MKPTSFAYHAPKTLAETVALLGELSGDDALILAGGQSLVPTMAFRLAQPAHLIDINGVHELATCEVADGALAIGALVRHAAFHRPTAPGPLGDLLAHVVRHIAHLPIRTRGAFCGSLAHADPAAEWLLVAATLGAEMQARGPNGARAIAAEDFVEGMMTTALAEDELLERVRLPLLAKDVRWGFYEFSRRAGDFALAMALATFRLEDGLIADARLGLGAAEERARRIPEAEAALDARPPEPETFAQAADAAAQAIEPLEDTHADAAYRRDLARAVTRRALARCVP